MLTKNSLEKYAPINTVCMLILAATSLTAFLVYTKTVLMPFVLAVFIYMVANTSAGFMKQKWQVPYILGLVTCALVFLGLATLAVFFVSSSIETFVNGADIYTEKLNDTLEWALQTAQKYSIKLNAQFIVDTLNKIPVFNMVKSVGGGVVSFLTNLTLISLFVIFIFMGKASSAVDKPTLVGTIQKQISFYLIIKLFVSMLAACFTWLVLLGVRSELAGMLAILTFILNFIPNLGPFISTMLPMPVLFLQYGLDWHIALALCLLTAIHFVIGNILETKWLGKGMDLDPVVVIACLIYWALVWGIMGALLAVPLTAIAKMVFERYETTKPLANLLAGRVSLK
ncbi:AI-2E family transporter [Candidatus Avelusimicrobium faecicola]|uniref:AI-2E family transporter n=1 Tax=Candidatus Avelusimicrobium faecicola TaxID=3416205 RepID=UPI003D0CE6CD